KCREGMDNKQWLSASQIGKRIKFEESRNGCLTRFGQAAWRDTMNSISIALTIHGGLQGPGFRPPSKLLTWLPQFGIEQGMTSRSYWRLPWSTQSQRRNLTSALR